MKVTSIRLNEEASFLPAPMPSDGPVSVYRLILVDFISFQPKILQSLTGIFDLSDWSEKILTINKFLCSLTLGPEIYFNISGGYKAG